MIIRLDWTEWQLRKAADALEATAAATPEHDLECLLNLSKMHHDLLQAAETCLAMDKQAIRQEWGI